MGQRASKLCSDVMAHLGKVPGVHKICPGSPSWYRGRKMLKVSNGTPHLVIVRVCEPEGQWPLHIYAENCGAVTAAVRVYGNQENIIVRE